MLDILNNFSAVLWSSNFLFRFRFLRRIAKLSSNCSGWVWFWWSCYVLLCCPFNPLSFVVWAAGCPCQCTVRVPTILSEDFLCVSLYRQSTYYLVWGFSLVLSKYLPSCLRIFAVLSEYLPWCTCKVTSTVVARCLQICCQSTVNLGELHLLGVS